ncbi:MAG TPA: cytochrome c oxidase subunit 3 [Anaerolineales bacterium]|nr:cytochrome c oxidase subunit 3 [Anaerolineales bacterium]
MAGHAETMGHEVSLKEYREKSANNRLGLWLFLFSDAFVFAGLLLVRFNLMPDSRPELSQSLGLLVTAILLLSSFFMNRAEIAVGAGDQPAFLQNVVATLFLGTLFLIGVVFVEWPLAAQHISAGEGVAGTVFFTMTGFHAFHVLTGLIFLLVIASNARKGLYTPERHYPVEACAIYWHFVDVVWVFFYPALYLIGTNVIGG